MAQLDIKGHSTRGKEVIELLEMFGYVNYHKYSADCDSLCFYGGKCTRIPYIYYDWVNNCEDMHIFSLEEFLEKYPYKVGDKVQHQGATSCGTVYVVEHMNLANDHIEYEIRPLFDYNHTGLVTVLAEDLQPYKEQETMEEDSILNQLIEYFKNTPRDIIEKEWHEYDKYNEIGPTVKEYLESINKSKYPKTYEECCKVLSLGEDGRLYTKGYKASLIQEFQQLLICRDAYWQIAGEQMELGKPWKPENPSRCYIFTIENSGGNIIKNALTDKWSSRILVFPTEEMRDMFYKNFKELVEVCKELL